MGCFKGNGQKQGKRGLKGGRSMGKWRWGEKRGQWHVIQSTACLSDWALHLFTTVCPFYYQDLSVTLLAGVCVFADGESERCAHLATEVWSWSARKKKQDQAACAHAYVRAVCVCMALAKAWLSACVGQGGCLCVCMCMCGMCVCALTSLG